MNFPTLFRSVLLLALMVSVLVFEGGYMLLTLLLAGFGLAHGRQLPATYAWVRSSSGATTVLGGLCLYLVVGVFLGIWHSYKINYYEAFVPFVLAPLILHGVLSFKVDHRGLWLATAVGALFAFVLAAYQVFSLDVGRAFGGLKNPIIFGDLSIVFGAFALLGFVYCPRDAFPKGVRWFLLAGFFFGLGASLLSGSKGGWMSVFLILFVFVWAYFSHRSVWFRLAAYCVGLLVVIKLFLLETQHSGAPCQFLRQFRENCIPGGTRGMNWTTVLRLYLSAYCKPSISKDLWSHALFIAGGQAATNMCNSAETDTAVQNWVRQNPLKLDEILPLLLDN